MNAVLRNEMVPEVGIEPTWALSPLDFESSAYTNFATPAGTKNDTTSVPQGQEQYFRNRTLNSLAFYFSSGNSFVFPRSSLANRDVVSHAGIASVSDIRQPSTPIDSATVSAPSHAQLGCITSPG